MNNRSLGRSIFTVPITANPNAGQLDEMVEIAGEVFDDLINPGVKDRVEGGLGGWTIFIDEDLNGEFDRGEYSALSSSTGGYYFPGLSPGLHHIQAIAPEGFEHTTPDVWQVFLRPGESNFNVDFGGILG